MLGQGGGIAAVRGAHLAALGLQRGQHRQKEIVLAAGIGHIRGGVAVGHGKVLEQAGHFKPFQFKAGAQRGGAGGHVGRAAGHKADAAHAGINL